MTWLDIKRDMVMFENMGQMNSGVILSAREMQQYMYD